MGTKIESLLSVDTRSKLTWLQMMIKPSYWVGPLKYFQFQTFIGMKKAQSIEELASAGDT